MFKEITGNAWNYYEAGAHICITTNGTTTGDGDIVCGAGIAEQARTRWVAFPTYLGHMHRAYGQHTLMLPKRMISFPVKFNWWEEGNLNLIQSSFIELLKLVDIYKLKHVILPRPGCGNGKLDWEVVKKKLMDTNDDTVSWKLNSDRISIITNHSVEKALAAGNQYG